MPHGEEEIGETSPIIAIYRELQGVHPNWRVDIGEPRGSGMDSRDRFNRRPSMALSLHSWRVPENDFRRPIVEPSRLPSPCVIAGHVESPLPHTCSVNAFPTSLSTTSPSSFMKIRFFRWQPYIDLKV